MTTNPEHIAWLSAELDRLRQRLADYEPAEGTPDAIWHALTPAAKASWVAAMQPQPEAEPLTACPECDEVAVTTTAGPLPVCLACDWTGWKDES